MKSKVISINTNFIKNPQKPLSRLMIVALIEACDKQSRGLIFTPKNITGSFTSLVRRGLIAIKENITNGEPKTKWQVTSEAVEMLKAIGLDVPC